MLIIFLFYIIFLKLLDEERRSQYIATQLDDSDDDYPHTYEQPDIKIRVRYLIFCLFIFPIFNSAMMHFIFKFTKIYTLNLYETCINGAIRLNNINT